MKEHNNLNWIEVSERLPNGDEYVLTYFKSSGLRYGINWFSTFSNKWMLMPEKMVTHWASLHSPMED